MTILDRKIEWRGLGSDKCIGAHATGFGTHLMVFTIQKWCPLVRMPPPLPTMFPLLPMRNPGSAFGTYTTSTSGSEDNRLPFTRPVTFVMFSEFDMFPVHTGYLRG